jgi:hypothetical protein
MEAKQREKQSDWRELARVTGNIIIGMEAKQREKQSDWRELARVNGNV